MNELQKITLLRTGEDSQNAVVRDQKFDILT